MAYRTYSPGNGFLVAQNGTGDFKTIQAAINAASSQITGGLAGVTIFIADGIYLENPVLQAGIDLFSFTADAFEPNVIINGNLQFSGNGSCTISGIELATNGNFALTVSGSNASILNLFSCNINCSNHTGISFTNSNASSTINIFDSNGTINSNTAAFFSHSSAGMLRFEYFTGFNANFGNSLVPNTISAGLLTMNYCAIDGQIAASGLSTSVLFCCSIYGGAPLNISAIVTSANAQVICYQTNLAGGSAPAANVNSSTSFLTLATCAITTNNLNALTGSGTLVSSQLTFLVSTNVNVATQTLFQTSIGAQNVILPSSDYLVVSTDNFVGVNTSGARNITLPATPTVGQTHIIADVTGTASTHNITVVGNGNNILGSTSAANYTMINNGQSDTFIFTGSIWKVT